MKHTKIIVALVLAGVFAFSPALLAAEKKGKKKPESAEKGKGNPMLEKLGLSGDQQKAFMALQKETGEKRKEAGKDKDAQKAVNAEFQAKLKDILSEEQMATFKKFQAEARKGGKDAPKKGKKKGGDN